MENKNDKEKEDGYNNSRGYCKRAVAPFILKATKRGAMMIYTPDNKPIPYIQSITPIDIHGVQPLCMVKVVRLHALEYVSLPDRIKVMAMGNGIVFNDVIYPVIDSYFGEPNDVLMSVDGFIVPVIVEWVDSLEHGQYRPKGGGI